MFRLVAALRASVLRQRAARSVGLLPRKLRRVLPLSCIVCCVNACQTREHPPFAADQADEENEDTPHPSEDGGAPPIITAQPSAISGCGDTVELPILRPNFYFIIDYSESMQEVMPDSGGTTRLNAARESVNSMLRSVGGTVNYGLAIFPDPTSEDVCGEGREVFTVQRGDDVLESGEDGPTLNALMSALRRYPAYGGTPVSPTLAALASDLVALPGRTYAFLVTDGAPNCNLARGCGPDMCIPNIEGAEFEDGTRCDDNLNCCAADLFPHLCLDEEASAEGLAVLASAGIPTFVIGMPGAEAYAETLDRMAEAAGTAQADAATSYYGVKDTDELATTLALLGRQVLAECTLDLGVPAEQRDQVQLLADGEELTLDVDWQWSTDASVVLIGDTCERWKRGELSKIRLEENCRPNMF